MRELVSEWEAKLKPVVDVERRPLVLRVKLRLHEEQSDEENLQVEQTDGNCWHAVKIHIGTYTNRYTQKVSGV